MKSQIGASLMSLSSSSIPSAPSRRLEFRIAVMRQGRKMYDVAADLGVSYNHLVLVLDGKRKGSAELEAGIAKVLE